MQPWSPTSWQNFYHQNPIVYPDQNQLQRILEHINAQEQLVELAQIDTLKQRFQKVANNQAFILQGGDCAECFKDCTQAAIDGKLKLFKEMAHLLENALQKEIIQIGRMAGQYAKPRSLSHEIQQHIQLPSYQGDLINQPEFTLQARTPNPALLLAGYECAKKTYKMIQTSQSMPFYTSHEALHLAYESALTYQDGEQQQWFLSTTHFPWVGMRHTFLNSAHIEFVRGIDNPIGLKIGPNITPSILSALLTQLNPQKNSGKIVLITRLGTQNMDCLSKLIQMTQTEKHPVIWMCDPMHGNLEHTQLGIKTRRFDRILEELYQTIDIHHQENSRLSGVHLELTGESVTECLGSSRNITEQDLTHAYKSLIDPRLNYEQSLELAIKLGIYLRQNSVK